MKIFIDLDGTVIDVFPRYYQIIRDFFRINNDKYDEYVLLKKRYGKDEIVIEKLLGVDFDIKKYKMFKKENLENLDYLKKDRLLIEVSKIKDFITNNDACILSCRSNLENARKQIEMLDLNSVSESIYFIKPNGVNSKYEYLKEIKEPLIMVGDSEIDMQVIKCEKAKTVFVRTGLRQENKLDEKPTMAFDNLNGFIEWYKTEGSDLI